MNTTDELLMTKKNVADYLRLSVQRISHYMQNGLMPAPLYLSPRTPRWRKADIDAMVDKMNTEYTPLANARRARIGETVLARNASKRANGAGGDA